MTFLGAMLALLLPRSAWRVIQRRGRSEWRQDHFLRNSGEESAEDPGGPEEGGETVLRERSGSSRSLAGAVVGADNSKGNAEDNGSMGRSASGSSAGRVSRRLPLPRRRRSGSRNGGVGSGGHGRPPMSSRTPVAKERGDSTGASGEQDGGVFDDGGGGGDSGGGGARDASESSLDLSIQWEGMVLKDVELRRDFLAELLGMPIDVPHAFVRRAVLHLPWYTLMLGSFVAKLEGVHIIMRGDAGDASASTSAGGGEPDAGIDGQQNDSGSTPPEGGGSGSSGSSGSRQRGPRPGTGRPRPLPRWLKWILRRLKVKLTDVTVRYESVGMCPLQGAVPAAMEFTLESLDVRPISLQGASAWFKRQVRQQQRVHQYREEMLLRGLAVSVEPLVDPGPILPPPGIALRPSARSSRTPTSAASFPIAIIEKTFLLEPTTISAQAFVVSRLPPRQPPLAGGGGAGGEGREGRAERGTAVVRAISLHGEAWRTVRPSLLRDLPNVMRNWAQGERAIGANEPVTFNVTEDAMSLVWGVLEEVLRLMEMHSGGGTSASAVGERGNGDGGSESTDEGEDAFSEDEWYDAFGSEMETGENLHGRGESKSCAGVPDRGSVATEIRGAFGVTAEKRKRKLKRPAFLKRNNRRSALNGLSVGATGVTGAALGGGTGTGTRRARSSRALSSQEGEGGMLRSETNLARVGSGDSGALTTATERFSLGPRAKPGLELSFAAGLTVNLVRRNAYGELGPGDPGFGFQRCRITATGLRAGGIREPSDGWGSPPPQHRGWLSMVSLTAGAPPLLSTDGTAASAIATGHTHSARVANDGDSGGDSGPMVDRQAPWLLCNAASNIATPVDSAEGSVRSGGGGASWSFLDVKAAGRAGIPGGTGSCASLVVKMGKVEAWAVGGAARRWVDRLGPKPGVLPEPRVDPKNAKPPTPWAPQGSVLREALFNGGCKDVIVPISSSGGGGGSSRNGGSTTTVAWPQCSVDLRGVIVHFPVDRAQPFGRALRVSMGGVTALDVESAAQTASATAASPASDGAVGTAATTSSSRRASATRQSLTSVGGSASAKKMGLDVSIAAIGAAWIPGVDKSGRSFGSARERPSRREFRHRIRRRAAGNVTSRIADGRGSEQPVVLDVRDAIGVKVRLMDDGGPSGGPAAAAAAAAARQGGGSGFLRDMAEAATRVEGEDDLGVEELLPPVAVIQESLSVDVKAPPIPISISTAALTELAWILGGFVVGDGAEDAKIDPAEFGSGAGAGGIAAAAAAAAAAAGRGGQGGTAAEYRSSTGGEGVGERRGTFGGGVGRRGSRMWRVTNPSQISPLMPVKVIYRRPTKVRRLLVRVRVASLNLSLADAARLPKVGVGPEVLDDTMPWGLGARPGHPVLSLSMDGVVLAVVVREASGRRGRERGRRSSIGSRAPDPLESSVSSRLSRSGSRSRRGSFQSTETGVSVGGGQGMTEGAITLTAVTIRSEGSDAGVDKPRGIMLPILVASPEARSDSVGGGSRRGSMSSSNIPSSVAPEGGTAEAAAAAEEAARQSTSTVDVDVDTESLSQNRAQANLGNVPTTTRTATSERLFDNVDGGGTQQWARSSSSSSNDRRSTIAASVAAAVAAAKAAAVDEDEDEEKREGAAVGPVERDSESGGSSRGGAGAPAAAVASATVAAEAGVGDEGGAKAVGGGRGPSFPPHASFTLAAPSAGLVVSSRWTLEPLHGGSLSSGAGRHSRRRSSRGGAGAGMGTGVGGGGSEDAGRAGEVGLGLVKRSMEVSFGRLELWPDPVILGRISHLIRGTIGAKDLSSGLARRERARKYRRERGLDERPPGGEDAVWPPVDDPLEELTELVWPSSELPALEFQLGVQEAACLLSFHGRPLSELQFKRGLTMGVKTYRQGLGRRAMECRGAARGMLLWDRTGSASGELACVISGLSEPHPSAPESAPTAAASVSAATPLSTDSSNRMVASERAANQVPSSLLPPPGDGMTDKGEVNNGVELEWSFTGRVSEAEANASRFAGVIPMGDGTPVGSAASDIAPGVLASREPRPPVLRLRFSRARIVYLQRFTMEQYCHIWQRLLPCFSSAFLRPEDSLCGSPVAILAQKAGLRWVQGCTPQLPERRRTEKACRQRPIVIECVVLESEIHLPECSDHRDGRTDALVFEIPKFCLFRPPVRRRVPDGTQTGDNEGGDDVLPSPASGKKSPPPSGAGRSRALGLGLGESGLGGGDSGWEEAEPTDFVYTGLFPHEIKGGEDREELFLFEDEGVDDGQTLQHLEAREAELLSQEAEESLAEKKTKEGLTEAEKTLSAAEKHQRLLEVTANSATLRGGILMGAEDHGDSERISAAMEVVAQVNRVGELKLALEERERALARVQSQLEAVRREADAERTAQEERVRFEAHRPSRVPPAPFRFDIIVNGLNIRSYRSASMIAQNPCRPWCNGGTEKESGMYPGVWDSLEFLPNNDPMFAKEALEVTILLDQLDLSLTRGQYATILAIIMDNFVEPWAVCPPVIEWPRRDPEVSKGVCRDALKGRRTAQTVPVYARRLRLTVSEDEEAFFFAPNQGPLDHGRRDWVAERRAVEASRRASILERQREVDAADLVAPLGLDTAGGVVEQENGVGEVPFYGSPEDDESSWESGLSDLDNLEQEIQVMAANLDGFSDDEDEEDDDDESKKSRYGRRSVSRASSAGAEVPRAASAGEAAPLAEATSAYSAMMAENDFDDSFSFYSGDDLQYDGPPAKPVALVDLNEFFLAFDKKWMNGGVAMCCGAGSISIFDLAYEDSDAERQQLRGGERQPGLELVSPLTSKGRGYVMRGGRESRHPGAGFGYNGPDPRVRFDPQIWYDMHMATDYKRCSVFVSGARVVALARGLTALQSFFHEPVVDFRDRDRMFRPHRYVDLRPNNLDVEVILVNNYVCLPESQWKCTGPPPRAGASSGGSRRGGKRVGVGRAVMAHADVTLTLSWRGLPQTGPGSSLLSATALVDSIFLAPLSEPSPPRPGESLSLITPMFASVRLETITASPSWRRAGPEERWAGMQGGERTQAGRKLMAAVFAAERAAETAPIPPREAEPIPPRPTEKAAAAAAEMEEADREERAASEEPATVSRSVSVVMTDVTEARLRRWRKSGRVDLHGPGVGSGPGREGFGGVESRMSLSDIKLITDTSRSMAEALRRGKTANPTKALRQAHRQQLLAFARVRRDSSPLTVEGYERDIHLPASTFIVAPSSSSVPAFSDPARMVTMTGPHPEPLVEVSMLQAGVGLPDLRLNIISNALALPLFHFDVRRLQAALRHEADEYLDATASATIAAGYFNQALYRREPVLEEFPVAMALHRDEAGKNSEDSADEEGARKRGVLEAQLSLPEVVNVNVTHAMVSALQKKALALSEDRVTTGARSRQPFRMRNRCGEALALTIRRKGRKEVRFTLEDGGDDVVDFGALSSAANAEAEAEPSDVGEGIVMRNTGEPVLWDSIVSGSTMTETRHSLVVAMRHRDWLYVSSHVCPVDAAGVYTLRMRRMDGSSPKPRSSFSFDDSRRGVKPAAVVFLVAEVRVEDEGTRVLTIRTRVSIENACPIPVRLSLGRPGGRRLWRNLDAGCIAHVPLTLLEPDLEIHARPATASAGGAADWAALVQSLGATQRMAEAAPRERIEGEEDVGSGTGDGAGGVSARGEGGGQTKIFAASNASASSGGSDGGTRSVRHFAGANRGAENGSGVALSGWWVLAEVLTRHDAPVPASSLKDSKGGGDADDVPIIGPGGLSRTSSSQSSWSELMLQRVSSASLDAGGTSGGLSSRHGRKWGDSNSRNAAASETEVSTSDAGLDTEVEGVGPSSPVFEKALLQPWHPLNLDPPSPSTGHGGAFDGAGFGAGLLLSGAEGDGDDDVEEDYDDHDGDDYEEEEEEEDASASTSEKPNASGGDQREGARKSIASRSSKGTVAASAIAGWSEARLPSRKFGKLIAAAGGVKRFCLKREIRSSKGGAVENVMREVLDALSQTSPLPSLSTAVETPPTVSLCLRAPLVLHNLLCVPMLYRIVNRQGLLCAEGVLPVGSSLPMQRLDLCQKQYASFLVVNYPWSPFIKIHSPTSAHPHRESVRSTEVRGLRVSFPDEDSKKGRELPNLHLHVALQGREVSVFCRLWLVNRTEMVLQHRDASLAMGVDATFMGDRMPQTTQPGQQEASTGAEGEGGRGGHLPRATEESMPKVGLSPARSSRALDSKEGSLTPSRRSPTAAGIDSSGSGISSTRGQSIAAGPGLGGSRRLSSGTAEGSVVSERSISGSRSGGPRIAFTVALPFSHLEEVDVEIPGSDNVESLIVAVATEAELGPLDPMEYFLCPLQPVRQDDALALTEIMTSDMDKLSLVDGQLRALKQSFGVSSGGSRPSSGYARWDRLGFIFDDYRPIHPSTLVSNLATPWLRMCHRAELAAASQASQWLGAAVPPGSGVDALVGPRPSSSRRTRALAAAVAASETSSSSSTSAGFLSKMQSMGGGGPQAGGGRAAATGSRGQSARLSETFKGVAAAVGWGRSVMFSPAATLGGFQVCSRVPDSEWCSPVDVASLKAATGGTTCISMTQERPSTYRDFAPRTQYDVGIQVGPGEGDFRRTLVLTLVPRYILVNALPEALEFTQAACGGRWRGILPSGSRQAFHWPFAFLRRALSVRFLPNPDEADPEKWLWSGDLKLDTIGEVAVKLRMPTLEGSAHDSIGRSGSGGKEYIARVKLALVGASVTVVFERQDLRWPPYRVDNLTSLGIRYRQALSTSDAAKVPAAGGGESPGELPWDSLGPQAAAPYTWDQPAGESRVLTVGFEQVGKWEEREYRLDELEKHRRVSLTRTLPPLNNPRFQGEILQRRKGTLTDTWRPRWGVLKGPVLFLFRDRSCVILKGVIYLGATRNRGRRGGAGEERPQRARIGQKVSGRETGDILDKMGNMMDDAVGMLVGPEMVRTEEDDGAGGDVAAAAASAAGGNRASSSRAQAGGQGTVMGGLDDQAGTMHADEALALAGMIWNHMKQNGDIPQHSWGIEGGFRRRLSQSVHGHDGGVGGGAGMAGSGASTTSAHEVVAEVSAPAVLRPSSSVGYRQNAELQREGSIPGGTGDGSSNVSGKRSAASFHQGLTLPEWGEVLTKMGVGASASVPSAPSGNDAKATATAAEAVAVAAAVAAERMCRQLVELGLLLLPPSSARRHLQASAGGPTTPRKGRGAAAYYGEPISTMKNDENHGGGASTSVPYSSMSSLPVPLETPLRRDRFRRQCSLDEELDEMESRGRGREGKGMGDHALSGARSGRTKARERSFGSRSLSLQASSVERFSARRYLLRRPGRDLDFNPEGTGVLTVVSSSGAKHDLRCGSTPDALLWIEAMRDAVDADCVQALQGFGRSPTEVSAVSRATAEQIKAPLVREGSRLEGGEAIMSRLRAKVYVNVRVRADGPTKVLELVEEAGEDVEDDDGAVAAALGPRRTSTSAISADAEASDAGTSVTSVYMLQMAGVGVSLVDDRPLELLYLLAGGISADITATARHRMLSVTVDWLQVDNQLHSALFPALLRPRPLPPAKRLADGSKAPVGVIQLDGLAPRPADRPPALHFFAKRRAADPDAASRTAMKRQPARSSGFPEDAAASGGAVGGPNTSGGKGGDNPASVARRGEAKEPREDQEDEGVEREELDQVVYYYDMATVWARPVDLKVEQAIFLSLMRLREKFGVKPSRSSDSTSTSTSSNGGRGGAKNGNRINAENLGSYTRSLWSALGETGDTEGDERGRGRLGSEPASASGYWDDEETRARLVAFADTLRAGESALSPAVFDAGGGRRSEVKIYFALMHFHPLDVRITYRSTPGSDVQDAEELTLSTIAQLDNARLCLNALQLEHAFGGRGVFAEVMLKHYKMAFLTQVHNVVGSFDFLGDPVGLLSNLSTGVKDFFYEPIEGLKPDGKGFLYGLGKGGTSLVSNTVQGTFNTFNKVTGSLGDTISQLSLDTDYRRRRVRDRLVQGETMVDSMTQGAKEFGRGIFQGVTGVVMQPYLGAEREGVLGFGKGMVKGVVGVAVKPVVGVFDLGARAFEGIRNASRFEDESGDGSSGDYLADQHQHQLEADFDSSSGRPSLGVVHEGLTADAGAGAGGGATMAGPLSLRARPPRMFGPLGEMDPFTWESAVAQAVLRAAMRDDRDVPSERIHWFRRFQLRTRQLRAPVLRSDDRKDGEEVRRRSSSAGGGRGVGKGAEESSRGGLSSPLDEVLVTRWVIVTDKRMLHAQEEPRWGADKEKVKALDLARFGVAFSPFSPALGAVRVLWDAPLSSVRSLELEPAHEGIKVSLGAPVEFSTDYQELPLFLYTQQGGVTARLKTVVCDPDTMSELSILALLQMTLGPEFARSHLVRPQKHAICTQGYLTRVEEVGLLRKDTVHWYTVSNGILYEYSPRKDALPDGSRSPPVRGLPGERRRWRYPYTLTTVFPLSGVTIQTGKVDGNESTLKISRTPIAGTRNRDLPPLPVVTASARLESVLKGSTVENLVLQADSRASLREWVDRLVSQSSSTGGERARKKEMESLFREVFVACESLGDTEAESLCADLRDAVSTRGVGVE